VKRWIILLKTYSPLRQCLDKFTAKWQMAVGGSQLLYWSAVQIGRQGFMKARDSRIGHGRAKVTFGNARQVPSAFFSCCHAFEPWKSASNFIAPCQEDLWPLTRRRQMSGKGAEQSAMHTTLTATARARGRGTSCAASLSHDGRFLLDVITRAKFGLRAGSQVAAVVNEQTVRNLGFRLLSDSSGRSCATVSVRPKDSL